MNAVIKLTEVELKSVLAEVWKVEPKDVLIIIDPGQPVGELHYKPPSARVEISIPIDRGQNGEIVRTKS